uniref:MBOAT family O-acyltransferase n=1 Tax=Aliarcobacter sp. TaxID=2321116 RepID=UPI004047F1D7
MQITLIIIPYILLAINYLSLYLISIASIFLLMRIYSAYIHKAPFNLSTLSYIFYIPELITGPFRDYPSWNNRVKERYSFSMSITKILYALIFILLSGYIYSKVITLNSNIFYTSVITYLTLYIQFASMSEIANSISLFIGKSYVVNFNKPLLATSINDFWTRWHVSLGIFSKKYINQPLTFYLSKKIKLKKIPYMVSILITFLFIGLWHNLSLNYLLFGLYFGLIVLLEREFYDKIFNKINSNKLRKVGGIIYTQLVHIIGFTFIVEFIQKIIIHP